VAEKADWK